MRNLKIIFSAFLIIPAIVFSQLVVNNDSIQDKPERAAFESSKIIDNPTDVLFPKKTLEVSFDHRFGTFNGGDNDLLGLWAPSNIRLGVSYAVLDRLTVGFGTTKFDRLQDFNWKVWLLKQTRSNSIPVNVSYYGNFVISALPRDNFVNLSDRYSYFNAVIISRRITPAISLQLVPSISHFNIVDDNMKNDRWAIGFGGRAKISPQTSILLDYTQPITQFDLNPELNNYNNSPGLSLGVEIATSSHRFQIFIANYNGIVPQQSIVKNENDFFEGDILLGFTITRNYNF